MSKTEHSAANTQLRRADPDSEGVGWGEGGGKGIRERVGGRGEK
jgi:hypothetical protein